MKTLHMLALAAGMLWTGPLLAQADTPEEGASPTNLDARSTFAQEAWKVKEEPFMEALSLPPGFGTTVNAVDSKGDVLDLGTLSAAVSDDRVKAALNNQLNPGALKWVMVGLSITGVVVPVVLSIPGAVVGGVIGTVVLYRSNGTTTSDLPSRLSPLALGAVAGAMAGLGAGAVTGLLGMVVVGQFLSVFLKPVDGSPVVTAVTTHNRALAKSLQLDPETLPPEYFPVPL